jgi:hypothetical protein
MLDFIAVFYWYSYKCNNRFTDKALKEDTASAISAVIPAYNILGDPGGILLFHNT